MSFALSRKHQRCQPCGSDVPAPTHLAPRELLWRQTLSLRSCFRFLGAPLATTTVVTANEVTSRTTVMVGPRVAVASAARVADAEWQVTEWSKCSANVASFEVHEDIQSPYCISGVQHRTVICASASSCEGGMPTTLQFCVLGENCGWIVGAWADCTVSECGQTGTQERVVTCANAHLPGACPGVPPARSRDCIGQAFCNWYRSDWSECTTRCGPRTQHRVVECLDPAGCVGRKPEVSQLCKGVPSSCIWATSEWSLCDAACGGEGVQTREAFCRDPSNSCIDPRPEMTRRCKRSDGCTRALQLSANLDVAKRRLMTETTTFIALHEWFVGHWSDCSHECGEGVKTREVYCAKVCSVFRCTPVPEFECLEEKPDAETGCYGRVGPWIGGGVGGPCAADATLVSGTLRLKVNDPSDFVASLDVVIALRTVIFKLIGPSTVILPSKIAVTLDVSRRLRPVPFRRLLRKAVIASYSIAVPVGAGENVATEIASSLLIRTLQEVAAEIDRNLNVGDLVKFDVVVDLWEPSFPGGTEPLTPTPTNSPTITKPPPQSLISTTARPSSGSAGFVCIEGAFAPGSCLPGSAQLDGCGSSCSCCMPIQASPSLSSLPPRYQATHDAPSQKDDGVSFVVLVSVGSAGLLVFCCVLVCCARRVFASGSAIKKQGSKQNRKLSQTIPEDEAAYSDDQLTPRSAADACNARESRGDGVPSPFGSFDEPPHVGVGETSGPARHASSPTARHRSGSSSKRSNRRATTNPNPSMDGGENVYVGMSRSFHERRNAAKNCEAGVSFQNDSGARDGTSGFPRGTASPPRSTEKTTDEKPGGAGAGAWSGSNNHSDVPGGGGMHRGTSAGSAGSKACSPPHSIEGVEEGTVGAQASEVISKVDVELDVSRGNDLEWRRRNFKALLLKWHPDKNIDQSEVAAEVFKHLMKRRGGYLDE
eukprot:TRINITY_DN61269_c0_g1_i1.p1 TRINITY_DN61269_c0_g1~~TRINITY_DN61269_c0_g1_i1.p1  ORF type:complete len:937 (+),score=126.62 TRINITY_DN61269_c0_g1_i1:143-2953(+)